MHCILDPMVPQPYVVRRIKKETADTFTLEMQQQQPPNAGMTFTCGQFNMIYVFGIGEVPISISGDPTEKDQLIHTIRAVGPVTKALQRTRKGDILGVRGPYGTGWPLECGTGKDVLVIAGGLGLAPLRPVIYSLLSDRARFRKVSVLYGTRTPADILFQKELEQWRGRFDLDVRITVANANADWRGTVGWITALLPQTEFNEKSAVAFICGPELMMRTTALELIKRGMSDTDIYLSMERNMKCAVGFCGHCQFGPSFICKDGPVFPYGRMKDLLFVREL